MLPGIKRAAAAVALAGIATLVCFSPAHAATLPNGFEEVTLASGLTQPTNVAWAPDGRMFVAQKGGTVRVIDANGAPAAGNLLDISAHVNRRGDRGLLGIAVDKDFATNHYLYLLYTYENNSLDPDGAKVSRLSRVVVNADNTVANLAAPETVLLGSVTTAPCPAPDNTNDCMPSDSLSHSIGTVRVDPTDGTLWVGEGDGASWTITDPLALRTYDERTTAGKILHIDGNGHGLPGHPFCASDANLTHVCTKLFAKGFRNPYRFSLRPGYGPIVGDVGWGTREEIDLIQPGRSYGWPCYEGSFHTSGYKDLVTCLLAYIREGTVNADLPPAYEYLHSAPGDAVVGGPIYEGTDYPVGFQGDFFFGDYVQGFIRHARATASGQITNVQDFASNWHGVDLEIAPDGNLVFVDFGNAMPGAGAVKEVRYSPGNATPIARASADQTWGAVPLHVHFTGSNSSDSDNDALHYDWDFGDGTPHGTSADQDHVYQQPGSYTAKLTVDDGRGRSSSATVPISPGNSPPSAAIVAPVDGSTYRDGDSIQLDASATDQQDASVPDSAFHWSAILHHNTHIHVLADVDGQHTSLDTHDDHDSNTYIAITLTVTDSGGLSDSESANVYPEAVSFTIDSVPPGALATYGGEEYVAPYLRQSAIGFLTTISTAPQLQYNGKTYDFKRWSDGGARLHDITIPDVASQLVAVYEPEATSVDPVQTDSPGSRDVTGPVIAYRRLGSPLRRLVGSVSDPSGVKSMEVALRTDRDRLGCHWWWSPLGRLAKRRSPCDDPHFMKARLTAAGPSRWRWKVDLGGATTRAGYVLVLRSVDRAGNVTTETVGMDSSGSRQRKPALAALPSVL